MTSNEAAAAQATATVTKVKEHIVEIVSDSGEGAQKAGTAFAAVNAKMGNGVWTVEIIPAEVKPPARSTAGASGIRVRFGTDYITNMGDEADLVVAFNEQVLYGRIDQKAYREGTIIVLDSKWAKSNNSRIKAQYETAMKDFAEKGYVVKPLPIEEACLQYTKNPKLGKNMFIVGMLAYIYDRDIEMVLGEIDNLFGRKGEAVVQSNQKLAKGGYTYASEAVDFRFSMETKPREKELVVMNGNEAVGLGIMASGMDSLAMYPITPATSVSHYLGDALAKVGGFLHQAEDEIAAVGYAIGSSYAGKTAVTVTSGPGLALKTEFMGLAVMAEVPLVVVVVQRGGPSTGLPTKVEQGDLLAAIFGEPGDAPKIVIAPATIEECFTFVKKARELAEEYRTPVIMLTDANLATGVQPYPRPEVKAEDFSPPLDQGDWPEGLKPYEWNPETGLSRRPVPGQRGGEYVLTGLAHTDLSKVAYDPESNQRGVEMRSRKFKLLKEKLPTPEVHGATDGDLLVLGWGSTLGSIEEAVDRARGEGLSVSSLHFRHLFPLPNGIEEIFKRFKQVMTVEINYSDPVAFGTSRRLSQLAFWLTAHTRLEIDCWSNVAGQPIRPGQIYDEIVRRLKGDA
jgi:2-oxoglutarate ferredoxin oxidoreductase subunit alpha